MLIRDAAKTKSVRPLPTVAKLIESVSEDELRAWVKRFSVPRHFVAQPKANREAAETIAGLFRDWGYDVTFQGEFYNVVAHPVGAKGPMRLIAAHFDSTAYTPGADDNASAVAAMLASAKAIAPLKPANPVMFVAFNREEDGLLGSADYVKQLAAPERKNIVCAHVLEMVGYATGTPNSQTTPAGLPIRIPSTGNFLGILANGDSANEMNRILRQAKSYLPDFPTFGLRVLLGFEKYLPVLLRSDHAPFWQNKIPSVMWTDTSEFRNPHYHRTTDLPETLDYAFLRRVTQLLIATVMTSDQVK
jgi:hypothetical protein